MFYNDLDASLTKKMGFKRNSYDKKHVDDLKALAKLSKQLDKVMRSLKYKYDKKNQRVKITWRYITEYIK